MSDFLAFGFHFQMQIKVNTILRLIVFYRLFKSVGEVFTEFSAFLEENIAFEHFEKTRKFPS